MLTVLGPSFLKSSGGPKARAPPHTFSPLSETDFRCDWVRKPQALLSEAEASVSSNEKCSPPISSFILKTPGKCFDSLRNSQCTVHGFYLVEVQVRHTL